MSDGVTTEQEAWTLVSRIRGEARQELCFETKTEAIDEVKKLFDERDAAVARAERAEARIAEDDALIDRVGYCHTCAVELAGEPGDRPPSITCYDCACDHRHKFVARLDAVRALVTRWRVQARPVGGSHWMRTLSDELEAAIGGPE